MDPGDTACDVSKSCLKSNFNELLFISTKVMCNFGTLTESWDVIPHADAGRDNHLPQKHMSSVVSVAGGYFALQVHNDN